MHVCATDATIPSVTCQRQSDRGGKVADMLLSLKIGALTGALQMQAATVLLCWLGSIEHDLQVRDPQILLATSSNQNNQQRRQTFPC